MRIWIFSLLLVSLLGCKKEAKSSTTHKRDTVSVTQNTTEDSVVQKPTQPQIFAFVTELCDNKGYFDPAKYSRDEIEGTYKLWFQMGGTTLSTPSVFKLNDLEEIRRDKDLILAKLDKDFAEKKKVIENLRVVNVPYWQNIKKIQYKSLHQEYEFEKLQITSYSDPSVLINNKFTGKCANFAKAVNANEDEIIAEWRKLRKEMSKRNGNPQRILTEFESHLSSSNWKDYALIDLITFGWGNCANDEIERPLHDEKMYNEFNALFIKIDSECDEP
ncbi:hypothetical protein NZ698_14080 [Chryseobacterium sp. PBS4-4]|uniref:Uncharacterized protein n=1 Tax=Chryseobacterium edaphi TaxID=2976532 RepID=A0ABT2W801_9FLAO|nr:hypothetical protein [Chryseobacterium edaphi]MCU7618324.1 hypothetical protein [Chryseobacterium edaphi]